MAGVISVTAKEAVLLANSPSFLLRKLRMDVSVRDIVNTLKPEQILGRLMSLLSVAPESPVELTERYIWLIAFGVAAYQWQWREPGLQEAVQTLPWGAELAALLKAERETSFVVAAMSKSTPQTGHKIVQTGWDTQRQLVESPRQGGN